MNEVMILPEELIRAAEAFTAEEKELAGVLERLDKASGALKDKWAGAAQQVFYQNYENLRQYMEAFAVLIGQISEEMRNMAEQFEEVDK